MIVWSVLCHGEILQVGHGCIVGTDLAGEITRESPAVPRRMVTGGAPFWEGTRFFGLGISSDLS